MLAVCRLNVIPLRKHPDLTSEMISQALCGELAEVEEIHGDLWHIRLEHDGYRGWADSRQFTRLADPPARPVEMLTGEGCGLAVCQGRKLWLPLGIPLRDYDGRTFDLAGERWAWSGAVIRAAPQEAGALIALAERYRDAPYLWGGRTLFGIDCSGFTQAVCRFAGIALGRDTGDQILQGEPVASVDATLPGDLVFFASASDPAQRMRHVGLVTGPGTVLHASATVHEDRLTAGGLWRQETGELTHTITAIRRVSGLAAGG